MHVEINRKCKDFKIHTQFFGVGDPLKVIPSKIKLLIQALATATWHTRPTMGIYSHEDSSRMPLKG